MKLFLKIFCFSFFIFLTNANAQTEYPAPTENLSQANLAAQIPSSSDVANQAMELTPYGKFLKVYRIYDPFYDTWDMKEAELGNNRYYIEMKMKHFTRGGEGEALLMFKRRADKVRELQKMASYEILDFNESIENQVFHTRRVASGVFELKPAMSADNFYDNPQVYFPPDKKASAKTKTAAKPKAKSTTAAAASGDNAKDAANKNANANKNKANKNKAKANKGKAKSNKNKAKNMNNRNSCDCCNCCQNCGNNSNNSGKILNNIQNSTPQMDADSWKLNGETQI